MFVRICFILVSLLGFIHQSAYAQQIKSVQDFPNRIIKLIIPFNAGGPADALARPLAEALNKKFGYQVIIENKPGANAAIASQFVANSQPDGYTLLFASDAGMSLAPATQKSLSYNPAKDFVGVSLVAQFTQLLFVGDKVPVKSISELVAYVNKNPNTVSYASIGNGSQSHVALESLSRILKIKMTHVPYTGAPAALTDVVGGNVQVMMSTISGPLPFIKSGKIRPLALAGPERNKAIPNVPTFTEAGVDGFESRGWFGIVAPAKTPPEIVNILSKNIWEIVNSEQYISQVVDPRGFDVAKTAPNDFPEFLVNDRSKWKNLVSQMGDVFN
jgi:tripartite-type tricarboxylate transporter receptor subunit TctC